MKSIVNRLVFLAVVLCALVMLLNAFSGSSRADSGVASISTDKTDYSPGEVVVISGTGFAQIANTPVNVSILRPDLSMDYVNGTLTNTNLNPPRFLDPAFTDASGSFTVRYQLDGIEGVYTITATDGTNTATISFADTSYVLKGWDMVSHTWTPGNLAGYIEDDSVLYKFAVYNNGRNDLPLSELDIKYQFYTSKDNAISYDYFYGFAWTWGDYSTMNPPSPGTPFAPSVLTAPVLGLTDTASSPAPQRYIGIVPGAPGDLGPASIPSGDTLVIYFKAHLASTYVWTNLKEGMYSLITSQISWASTCTYAHGGAGSFSNGANLHIWYIDKIPIPVGPGAMPNGIISGHKWEDTSPFNRVIDANDAPVAGWDIRITGVTEGGVSIGQTIQTQADGSYVFNFLPYGDYYISEPNILPGWTPIGSTSIHVVLASDVPGAAGVDFLNSHFQPVAIQVIKKDTNNDPVVGWTVYLTKDSVKGTAQYTDTNGQYTWTNLGPGTYSVSEDITSGWTAVGDTTYSFGAVESGHALYTHTFVNFKDVTVTVKKEDTSGVAQEGWTIWMQGPSPSTTKVSDDTDASGIATFTITAPGTYEFTEDMETGWTLYSPASGKITLSDVVSGQEATLAGTFVNFKDVKITGYKFEDRNGNHAYDSADGPTTGIAWMITLTLPDGTTRTALTNAATGYYEFINLGQPGTYTLVESLSGHTGWIQTAPTSVDGKIQVLGVSGQDVALSAADGQWFGNFNLGTISGYKFQDLNQKNGRDPGEPGVNDWTIYLLDSNHNIITQTTTKTDPNQGDGWYTFEGLGVGTYIISEGAKSGWIQTYPASVTYTVSITSSGQTLGPYNFGNYQLKSLVTDSSLCYFDIDSGQGGQQFRLIFTPYESAFKLSASNPGQFYYNVFYYAEGAGSVTIWIKIPDPFVTQGAQPIHAYSGCMITGTWPNVCLTPGTELSGFTWIVDTSAPEAGYTIYKVTGSVASAGLIYVNAHLDYGYKSTTGFTKYQDPNKPDGNLDAKLGAVDVIPYLSSYTFWYSPDKVTWYEPTIQNENVFKKDPGIGGLVLRDDGTPISGVRVDISGGGTSATVYTDQDGWYMWQYKYTGKPTTFTVKLPAYWPANPGAKQEVTVKSNSFVVVNFGGSGNPIHLVSLPSAESPSSAIGTVLAGIAAMLVSCILVGILVSSGTRSFFTVKAPRTRTLRHSSRSERSG